MKGLLSICKLFSNLEFSFSQLKSFLSICKLIWTQLSFRKFLCLRKRKAQFLDECCMNDMQTNQAHDPEVNQSNCTSPRPTEFAHSKISGNTMPIMIIIFEYMAPSSCFRTKQTRPVHSAQEDLNEEKKQIGLRRSPAPASRKVCKWTVVRVEKQAARCRQISSFPWWRWQTILNTARLWTPVTLPFGVRSS